MNPQDERSKERGSQFKISVLSNLSLPMKVSFIFGNSRTPQFTVSSMLFGSKQITIPHSDYQRLWSRELGNILGIEIEPPSYFHFNGTVQVKPDGTMTEEAVTRLVSDVKSEFTNHFLL